MDGTVLDSEIIYHDIIRQLCEKFNKKYTTSLQMKTYGGTDREISETVVKELKLPISVDEFEMQMTDLAQKLLPSAPLQKGAERLLTHLHDYKIPMALATNSTEQAVRLHATARPKLFALFNHKFEGCGRHQVQKYDATNIALGSCDISVSITDPEVTRGKPQPDIYLVAASRFPGKPKPHQCLVFEDSAVGVTAAVNAGMQVVMIPDVRVERDDTRHATIVVKSLMDFHPELFGLPAFDNIPPRKERIET